MPSTLDYANVGVTVVAVATYAYVAYEALLVRRTIASGLYRRHAFGICLLALAFAGNQLGAFLPTDESTLGLIGGYLFMAFALLLFYWVDTSILAARNTDPLYRDTFRWSRVRYAIWGVTAFSVAFVTVASILNPYGPGANPPTWLEAAFAILFFFPVYSAAISGVVVIPVAARRSMDSTLRKHLRWFYVFLATQLILAGVVGQATGQQAESTFLDGVALLVGLYPLLQSAKTLVPLYRFQSDQA
jgi:hypothetical protein